MRRVLTVLEKVNFEMEFRYVPTHVDVYGNACADRLAKRAARRAHFVFNLPVSRTEEQREE